MEKEYFNCTRADGYFLSGEEKRAFGEYFQGATRYHDRRAAFNLAYMYQRGIAVPCNYRSALAFYTAASFMDGGEAEFNLSLMHLRGLGTPVDFPAAAAHMKKAAALGCIEAQVYLGTASLTGCVFDPFDIECISMIPFHRVIARQANAFLPGGDCGNPAFDDARYGIIEADGYEAQEYFSAAAERTDTDYTAEMNGEAKLMLGRFLIEGAGTVYNPEKGYSLILSSARENECRGAALYLTEHPDEAKYYGADPEKVRYLLRETTHNPRHMP